MEVCVLGLGEVGYPTAKYAQAKGLKVWGYDISSSAIEKTKKDGLFYATDNWGEIPSVDVYIVCVSTFQKNEAPDLFPVFDACAKISKKAKPSSLVSIESTIALGTSKQIFDNLFNKKINLVHAPHRYWAGDQVEHGVKQLRVIGGIDENSHASGIKFYRDVLGIPMHEVSSIEVAEMCKISENAYRFVQIAFSEELKIICEKSHVNFDELRNACNTKWNIEIPEARDGIGGHCLPKDIRYLSTLDSSNYLLLSAMLVDKKYREWLNIKIKQ